MGGFGRQLSGSHSPHLRPQGPASKLRVETTDVTSAKGSLLQSQVYHPLTWRFCTQGLILNSALRGTEDKWKRTFQEPWCDGKSLEMAYRSCRRGLDEQTMVAHRWKTVWLLKQQGGSVWMNVKQSPTFISRERKQDAE